MKYYVACGEENTHGMQEVVEANTPTDAAVIALSRRNYDNSSLGFVIYISERGFPSTRMELGEEAYPSDGYWIHLKMAWELAFHGDWH